MVRLEIAEKAPPERGILAAFAVPDGGLGTLAAELDARSGGVLRRAVELAGKRAKHGEIIDLVLPHGLGLERLLLVLVGAGERRSALELEKLGGKLVRALAAAQGRRLAIAASLPDGSPTEAAQAALHIAHGFRLRAYGFRRYRSKADEEVVEPEALTIHLEPGGRAGIDELAPRLEAQLAGVALARDLASEPPNVLFPEAFAERCRELAADGLEIEVLDPEKLAELGMRALLGVAQGSSREPYVVAMTWRGGEGAPLALVGKGVCFDSGGLSLKPAQGMEGMKWDMGGAGAVTGAMRAIARRRAKAHVVGVVGLVENMPSGTAQRPGDVVKAMSGKTIEVVNTDAEGRLLLADVLHYTRERFKPRAMIDLATLTGAIVVALGHERAGLFATDDTLADQLAQAGAEVGEELWRMPLGKAYSKHIQSEIADIKNVGRAREAGATAGAVFLQEFVGDTPWAHLDIAGVAWTSRDLALVRKGATGFGVRLLDAFVEARLER